MTRKVFSSVDVWYADANSIFRGVIMRYVTDVLVVTGGVMIVTGVTLIYAPAGFIVAGVLSITGAWLSRK